MIPADAMEIYDLPACYRNRCKPWPTTTVKISYAFYNRLVVPYDITSHKKGVN